MTGFRQTRNPPLLLGAFLLWVVLPVTAASAQSVLEKKTIEPKSFYWLGGDFQWLRTSDKNYTDFFGTSTYLGRLRVGWNPAPLVDHIFTVGFGKPSANTWATKQPDGIPVGAPGSHPTLRTLNEETLYLIPIETSLRIRGQFMRDQIVIPYIEGGPALWIFHDDFGQVSSGSVTGVKGGLFGGGGLMIDVIDIDSKAKRSLRADHIENAYLYGSAHYAWIDNFGGKGLDLSGWRFNFGLELRMKN